VCFNELILVPIHDKEASWEIFKVHTGKVTLTEDVYSEKPVFMTDQYTGADIEAVCKKAGRLALSNNLHTKRYQADAFS
jgi:transitional endoplasmic reticulum ATPase